MCSEREFDDFIKKNNGIFKYSELVRLGYNQRQIRNLEQKKLLKD